MQSGIQNFYIYEQKLSIIHVVINKYIIDEIWENKKLEIDNNITTYDANFTIFISSIFFPTQTKIKLLKSVAEA